MRAAIERNTASGTDSFNQPVAPSWTANGTIACYAWPESAKQVTAQGKLAVADVIMIAVDADADVLESDRISSIETRTGASVYSGPLEILAIERHSGGWKQIAARKAVSA